MSLDEEKVALLAVVGRPTVARCTALYFSGAFCSFRAIAFRGRVGARIEAKAVPGAAEKPQQERVR